MVSSKNDGPFLYWSLKIKILIIYAVLKPGATLVSLMRLVLKSVLKSNSLKPFHSLTGLLKKLEK